MADESRHGAAATDEGIGLAKLAGVSTNWFQLQPSCLVWALRGGTADHVRRARRGENRWIALRKSQVPRSVLIVLRRLWRAVWRFERRTPQTKAKDKRRLGFGAALTDAADTNVC